MYHATGRARSSVAQDTVVVVVIVVVLQESRVKKADGTPTSRVGRIALAIVEKCNWG